MQNVDRSVMHPPWYNNYASHYQEFLCMRLEIEALLYQYRADVMEYTYAFNFSSSSDDHGPFFNPLLV